MNQLQTLHTMQKALFEHASTMMDEIIDEGYDKEKHNVDITFRGETFSLDLHADFYEGLTELIEKQIEHERNER